MAGRFFPDLIARMLLISGLFVALSVNAAPSYVESPPLTQVVKAQVGTLRPGAVQVPVITWGGDIATIYANGNSEATNSGSIFANNGLELKLVREDLFSRQVSAYLEGRSPYLRGTMGMINMAAELLSKDPRTKPVVIYQMTWSAGGDALVVKQSIHSAKDLRGKTVALQAYGPHVDYLTKILKDAGLSASDVKIRWLPDLTGTDNTPMAAFYENDIDAAFVIIPDALALTSNGSVGTGAEDSVRGARILLSTKTANRIIADVYAVRSDYLNSNRAQVQAFVHSLLLAQERLKSLVVNKGAESSAYRDMIRAAAGILLDSQEAVADAEGLYADAEYVGFGGNKEFFANPKYPRNLERLTTEIQTAFRDIGLMGGQLPVVQANWDYTALQGGLKGGAIVADQRFDTEQVASVVAKRQQQGTLGTGELFSFQIFFKPNQNSFEADLYRDSFEKVIDLASTYGGAIITVEGHSDPMGFLRKKKEGSPEVVLGRIKQSAKNLSLSRAVAVRDSVIQHAGSSGINLDPSQFAVVGHGIAKPASGICGTDPCAPKSEREWRDNMRVEFRVIQVEAEDSVFRPL
ncbi:MAG: ABC transporter substrate-binding protein [Gammaproteobacteria bacterium]|nr:ABC transporter substrate-binding protein [Gammaproteobacteria bacterium]MCB1904866.1 ABC transporter substrate-binding protein [Gammaproteobacteria bacterium]